jgi:hypothetical protein
MANWLVTCLDRESDEEAMNSIPGSYFVELWHEREFTGFSNAMKYLKRCKEEGWEECGIKPLPVDTESGISDYQYEGNEVPF